MRILVTGGCGYVGSVLVPKLAALGHQIVAVDSMWFGNHLPLDVNVIVQRADFRELSVDDLSGFAAIIHLAGVANDPCGALNPKLAWEVNALGTMQLGERASQAGVRQFIYASSGSVYGVNEGICTEDTPIVPISDYNKSKAVAERALLSYADRMAVQIVRPGTVCGYSPRQRLDITVNQLTIQALTKHKIIVAGSELWRANIHIEDMCRVYVFMLDHPELTGVYNAAFQNITIGGIASYIMNAVLGEREDVDIVDHRSYRIDSAKLISAGFRSQFSIADAVLDMTQEYAKGNVQDSPLCYNIASMPR